MGRRFLGIDRMRTGIEYKVEEICANYCLACSTSGMVDRSIRGGNFDSGKIDGVLVEDVVTGVTKIEVL